MIRNPILYKSFLSLYYKRHYSYYLGCCKIESYLSFMNMAHQCSVYISSMSPYSGYVRSYSSNGEASEYKS